TERPDGEAEEGEGRDEVDEVRGHDRSERHARRHREGVHDRRRDRDADQDLQGRVARREGQGHELALVAELGDEDHAEAQDERRDYGWHRREWWSRMIGWSMRRTVPDRRPQSATRRWSRRSWATLGFRGSRVAGTAGGPLGRAR